MEEAFSEGRGRRRINHRGTESTEEDKHRGRQESILLAHSLPFAFLCEPLPPRGGNLLCASVVNPSSARGAVRGSRRRHTAPSYSDSWRSRGKSCCRSGARRGGTAAGP